MFKTILIPVDVSVAEDTQKLLKAAQRLTEGWDCALHAVTVVPDFGTAMVGSYFDKGFEAEKMAEVKAALSDALNTAGVEAQQHVLTGTIYDRIISLAQDVKADLIVIGAHRPELRDYLLGSNAARMVRHSSQSVLVLRD